MADLLALPTWDREGRLRVVVESPRGSAVKLKYARPGVFELARPLVAGVVYPFDWGFVPGTRAPDGDPLDAMVLGDVPTFPGVVIPCRPLGVVKVSQRKKKGGGRERNDRVIAVPAVSPRDQDGNRLTARLRRELEEFYLSAVLLQGKDVRIEGWGGAAAATALVRQAQRGAGR